MELLLGDKRAWRRAIMERMAEVRRRKEELLDVWFEMDVNSPEADRLLREIERLSEMERSYAGMLRRFFPPPSTPTPEDEALY